MKFFNSIAIRKPKKSMFDLSHERKISCNMGDLIPIYLEEIVPGDKFRVSSEIFMRLAPMIHPIMHRVNVYVHFFFVPNRIVWDNWEKFITGGEDGQYVPSQFPNLLVDNLTRYGSKTLYDYFGLPIPSALPTNGKANVNALPFRAYQMIYNEYYRDQNLQPKIVFNTDDSANNANDVDTLTVLRRRCWEKDYFTSALPWAQRGGEVGIPVDFNYSDPSMIYKAGTTSTPMDVAKQVGGSLTGEAYQTTPDGLTLDVPIRIENLEGEGVSVSINQLRQSARLQEWLEKNARGGARYIEQILSHFGVVSSDARLQRPEYLGGGKQPIVISEVLANFGSAEIPQGEMAGHGISVGKTNRFSKYFEEHGFVLGIMSVLPRTAYSQGIEKVWTKFDKFDYYFPEFAHLGEQEVKQSEVFHDFFDSNAATTFGYQSRYAEYKYKQSLIAGDFRNTLANWHMGRVFSTPPVLNGAFVESDPTHDIFNVVDENEDKLYVQIYNDVKALRPMPYYGIPTL